MRSARLDKEAVLRVGEVSAVTGRRIFIAVDRDKNLSELFFDGDVLRNIAVGSYIDIRKGFLSLIGRVEGENAQGDGSARADQLVPSTGRRILTVSLVGFLSHEGKFFGGTKELPLVGNEAYLLTREKVHQIHNLVMTDGIALDIALSDYEGYDIAFPADGLINSHIAIFGNTGSGKSNTLAIIFQEFIKKMRERNTQAFEQKCKIILFDFNGEYVGANCLTAHKTVYKLSTRDGNGDKLPLSDAGLLDIEMLSILSDATEKTQKPFLKRALNLYSNVMDGGNPLNHTKNILRAQIKQILVMSDKIRADLLLDYLRQILPETAGGQPVEIRSDLEWHNQASEFKTFNVYLRTNPAAITGTIVYGHVDNFQLTNDVISNFIVFAYIQLIYDVLSNRAQNEHVSPAINKLKSKQRDIRKVLDSTIGAELFSSNVVVVSLNDVNLEMRKTIPLLISRMIYQNHKSKNIDGSLNIIIDEAHNILSRESFREAESWKDYRLETFEEIIKEGRKFGVFVTIASQRPNDISHTITSQAHNYFIHRLINERDLESIASAVSYIDKLTEESIPTLPTGTCIFSGIAGQMPLKIAIKPLEEKLKPQSSTLQFSDLVPIQP